MTKAGGILLAGLLLAAAGFGGFYYLGTASCRTLLQAPQPELAWLRREFKLTDAEFARISALHAAYLPACATRCRHIEEENEKLKALLTQSTNVTPEIEALLLERARTRAECETEMMRHFLEVSRTMPPEQGRRYLAWVQQQTFLQPTAMEQRHQTGQEGHAAHHHPM